jgi:SSS family solute:Na+ symporter
LAWVVTDIASGGVELVNPGGPGWRPVFAKAKAAGNPVSPKHAADNLPFGILCMVFGCMIVYATLFATGYWIYAQRGPAIISTLAAVVGTVSLIGAWKNIVSDRKEL